jgi:hypothetical protein
MRGFYGSGLTGQELVIGKVQRSCYLAVQWGGFFAAPSYVIYQRD